MDKAEMKKHICSLINDDKVFIPIASEAFRAIDLDNNNCIDKAPIKLILNKKKSEFKLSKIDINKIINDYLQENQNDIELFNS